MGGSESKTEYSQAGLQDFHENFEYVKKAELDEYNEFKIYQEKDSRCYIATITDNFNITRDSKYFLEEILEAFRYKDSGILKIVGYDRSIHDGFCGIHVSITVYNEWYDHDLLQEIKDRAERNVCDFQ